MKSKPLYSVQPSPDGFDVLRRPTEGHGGRVVVTYREKRPAEDMATALRLYAEEEAT